MDWIAPFFGLLITFVVLPFMLAFSDNKKLLRICPHRQSFVWGFFLAWLTLILGVFGILILFFALTSDPASSNLSPLAKLVVGSVMVTMILLSGLKMRQSNRTAWYSFIAVSLFCFMGLVVFYPPNSIIAYVVIGYAVTIWSLTTNYIYSRHKELQPNKLGQENIIFRN